MPRPKYRILILSVDWYSLHLI